MKRVLVACEESGVVTERLRKEGIEAYSCDIIETSGSHPEWHIQQDVLPLLSGNCSFKTCDGEFHCIDGKWDAILAFPPCTYITIAANKYYDEERYGDKARERKKKREEACEFFMKFINADCEHIAVENPVGVMNTRYRKPDQIINPYEFGHPVSKKTCLWLKGLPLLKPTQIVEPERIHSKGRTGGYSGASWFCRDENGKILSWRDPRTAKIRSKTYDGIAEAFATQWKDFI